MRKIVEINKEDVGLKVVLDNGEFACFYPFAKNQVYSTVSDNLNKKTVFTFKQDILKNKWNIDKLKELYLQD
jgi:hypothetical protein